MRDWWRRHSTPSERSLAFNRKYALHFAIAILTPGVAICLYLDPMWLISLGATAVCSSFVVLAGYQTGFGSRGKWHATLVAGYYVLGALATIAFWVVLVGTEQSASTKHIVIMVFQTIIYAGAGYPTWSRVMKCWRAKGQSLGS